MASSTSSTPASPVTHLAYLRSQTSVDIDCLDLKGEEQPLSKIPIEDAHSPLKHRQWEAYLQLSNPNNAPLLSKSAALARQLQHEHAHVSFEELAVEIAVCAPGAVLFSSSSSSSSSSSTA
ncbi:MAG: hypothetical protein L6R36_006947 [Xanthoria steineri]|nr:MAG: hypothetical protein L6R36_006947 [Xanthoria steineri]